MWMRGGSSKGAFFLRDDLPAAVPLGDPQRDPVRILHQECQPLAVRRPVGVGEARTGRQRYLRLAPVAHILERQRVQPLDAHLRLAVGRRVDAIAAQPQDRLRHVGDRRQVLAPQDRKRPVVGADRHPRRRRTFQDGCDRGGRAVVACGVCGEDRRRAQQQGDHGGTHRRSSRKRAGIVSPHPPRCNPQTRKSRMGQGCLAGPSMIRNCPLTCIRLIRYSMPSK